MITINWNKNVLLPLLKKTVMKLELWIPAVALVVVIILIIKFHPAIIIFLSRIFNGKYNPKYIQTHKNFTGKSPYGYCIKDDFINHVASFYDKSKPAKVFESKASIEFGSLPFESKYRHLLKQKGKPFCVNLLRNVFFDLKIFGYRDELIGFNIKAYFHFIDKRFFMGEYTLKTPPENKMEELSAVLQKKYLGELKTNSEKYIIKGANKVLVLFENTGFNLSIKYLHQGKGEVNVKLSEFWDNHVYVKPEPENNVEAELMDRL
jgi:hypothetical protein